MHGDAAAEGIAFARAREQRRVDVAWQRYTIAWEAYQSAKTPENLEAVKDARRRYDALEVGRNRTR